MLLFWILALIHSSAFLDVISNFDQRKKTDVVFIIFKTGMIVLMCWGFSRKQLPLIVKQIFDFVLLTANFQTPVMNLFDAYSSSTSIFRLQAQMTFFCLFAGQFCSPTWRVPVFSTLCMTCIPHIFLLLWPEKYPERIADWSRYLILSSFVCVVGPLWGAYLQMTRRQRWVRELNRLQKMVMNPIL